MFAKVAVISMMVALVAGQVGVSNNPSSAQLSDNDALILKYAATLENLESTYYNTFLPKFGSAGFAAAGYDPSIYTAFTFIQAHENAHSSALNQTLVSLGYSAVPVCSGYSWPTISTVQQFIAFSAVLENTGVTAYDGVVNALSTSPTGDVLIQVAATIATIEARHASFLNALNNSNPIPVSAFDTANLPSTIAGIVGGLLVGCSYNVAALFPLAYTITPVTNATYPNNPSSYQLNQNDIAALNYALFLEEFEANFYLYGQSQFTSAAFANAGYPAGTYNNFALIAAHEQAHVSALTSAVQSLGGTPTQNCTYNFASINTVPLYVQYAATFENLGVAAYDGALNAIYSPALKQAAATIATIEARHASYLNKLMNNASSNAGAFVSPNATGSAYDNAFSFNYVTNAVFATNLLSCPGLNLVTPQTVRLYSINNATTTAGATSRPVSLGSTSTGTSTAAGSTTGATTRPTTTGATTTPTSTTNRITGATSTSTNSASTVAVSVFACVAAFALLF